MKYVKWVEMVLPSLTWQKFHRWRWGRWGWRRFLGWSGRWNAPESCPQRPRWAPQWWPATLQPTLCPRYTQCPETDRTKVRKQGMSWVHLGLYRAARCGYDSVLWLTAKKASSNTNRGPEKPITRTGWAAIKQKMIPWTLVEIRSSGTPIMFSTLSAAAEKWQQSIIWIYCIE